MIVALKVLISCGEASGDLYAAGLVEEDRARGFGRRADRRCDVIGEDRRVFAEQRERGGLDDRDEPGTGERVENARLDRSDATRALRQERGVGSAKRQRDVRAAIEGTYEFARGMGIGSYDNWANLVLGEHPQVVDERGVGVVSGCIIDAHHKGFAAEIHVT